MNTPDTAPPPPAPLPSSSQAGRGELPDRPPAPPADDPDTPRRMAEDEFTLWLCLSIVGAFVALMVVVAAIGGL